MSNDNMALLAVASYADFKDIKNPNIVQGALIKEMPTAQAEKFTDTYDIIAHQSNTTSGYSGTIVKNKKTNEIFVLHRGTDLVESRPIVFSFLSYFSLKFLFIKI